jgi:hypothetical protein
MRFDGKTTPRRLRKLRVRRVDLVTAGANPAAHVTLAKAATPQPNVHKEDDHMPESDTDTGTPTLAEELAALSADEQTAVAEYVKDVEAELEAERAKLQAAQAALATVKAEGDDAPKDEELLKTADPAIVERLQKAEAAAAEATAKADAIVKAERARVFKATAASLVNLTGGDDGADRVGSILEKANALLDEADYAELERILVAADAQLTAADDKMTKAIGHSLDGTPTGGREVVDTIKARAEVLKGEGVDPVEALRQARRENAEAVAEYAHNVTYGQSD